MFDPVYQFLNKLGYMHPIHPTEVHMPIGLVVGACVFAYVALVFRRPSLAQTARHCIILAFIFLFPTMLFGFMDWQHFYAGAWLFPIKIKIPLAFVLMVLLLVAIVLGAKVGPQAKSVMAVYTLCLLTVVVLGFYGGQLVFGAKEPVSPAQFNAGRDIFNANCSACHPHGGNIIEPSLPLVAAPQLGSFESFSAFVRNPREPDGSKGMMPPFPASKIPDEEQKQLYDYIVNVLVHPKRR
jgi:uncharacterized membrane protein